MKNKNLSGGLFATKPTALSIRETSLSAMIADWLDSRRIYNDRLNCGKIKTQTGSWVHLCKTGTPDRFAIIRGRIVFVEVKMRGKKPSPEQNERHRELVESGAFVLVADSFDEFVSHFSALRASLEEEAQAIQLFS